MTYKILSATDLKSMSKFRISYNFLDIEKNKSFYKNLKKFALEEQVRLLKCPFWTSIDRDILNQSLRKNYKY